jgi:hypothetical protein
MVWHTKQLRIKKGERWRGAMGGYLMVGEDADKILGENMDYGRAFAYLFRRFGYPYGGWDGSKAIVNYMLTTPMDGVALRVDPTWDTSTSFGYSFREDIDQKVREWDYDVHRLWNKRRCDWVKKKYPKEDFLKSWDSHSEEYQAIEPEPQGILYEARLATIEAVKDLLLPVEVDGEWINILELWCENTALPKQVHYYELAGFGVGQDFIRKTRKTEPE